ncbi:hypothetical protein [Saccharopolyspora gregorii]|uniref:Uncharacterized protein n=1 Tax=Saccharopolyspora gregorii TaxID=33914 RepID=A0ABP6RJ83_9PSEU
MRRHFPPPRPLEAVSHSRIDALSRRAANWPMRPTAASAAALARRSGRLLRHRPRLAVALSYAGPDTDPSEATPAPSAGGSGHTAAGPRRAEGAVRADIALTDLITVIVGIVLAVEHRADAAPKPTGCSG